MVRPANGGDVAAMLDIYRPFVAESAVTFETIVPTEAEFLARVQAAERTHAWLVWDEDGIQGYAYGTTHRERAAYRWCTEVSVYVAAPARGRGIGRGLYRELLPRLAARGYVNAYAGIALPNPASVALHEALGFTPIGVYPRIGWKRGAWHDVGWWYLRLANPQGEPRLS